MGLVSKQDKEGAWSSFVNKYIKNYEFDLDIFEKRKIEKSKSKLKIFKQKTIKFSIHQF